METLDIREHLAIEVTLASLDHQVQGDLWAKLDQLDNKELVLQALLDQQDQREILDLQDLQGKLALQEHKDLKVIQVPRVLLVQLDLRDQLDRLDQLDHKVLQATLEIKGLKEVLDHWDPREGQVTLDFRVR